MWDKAHMLTRTSVSRKKQPCNLKDFSCTYLLFFLLLLPAATFRNLNALSFFFFPPLWSLEGLSEQGAVV